MRALVVCNGGGVGDAFMATPVMRALRRRYNHITALTQPAYAPVLAKAADDVWSDGGSFVKLVARLRAAKFDAAVVTWGTARSALALALAGIPERVGQTNRMYSPLYTARVELPSERGDHTTHWSQILLNYARALHCDGDQTPISPVDYTARMHVQSLLMEFALHERSFILLHPTRGISRMREAWPDSALARVAGALRAKFDLPVLISGTVAEADSAVRIARRADCISVAGRTSLVEFAALAEVATLVVAMDSGPMHLAAATGVPTVGIFAMRPDEPDRWYPLGGRTTVVRASYPCPAWHTKERCPDFACVRSLDAEKVIAAAAGLLDAGTE